MYITTLLVSGARRFVGVSTLVALASAPAIAQNIVSNPGFEVGGGSFAGYTVTADAPGLVTIGLGNNAHTGNAAAFLSSYTGTSQISQTLTTTAGQGYNVSFYAYNPGFAADGPNNLSVLFGGQQIFGQAVNNTDYELFSAFATAPSNSSLFQIVVSNPATFTQIDDISVTASGTSTVPEPGSMALLGTGLVGLVPFARRRRR
jgi:hypothetical protein